MTSRGKRVELHGVAKRYGDVTAVAGLDLVIEKGSFVSLLGPSGCGKTTTLRMIAGLEETSSGDILVDGERINQTPIHQRNFGLVFQNHALFPHKSAFDNVAFGLRQRKVDKAEIKRRVEAALALVRLPHVSDRLPGQLSGGQQQRIALARAVVIEPDLLLFDEPLSALDAGLREEMRIEIKRIQRTLGITTVFVTHDQGEALAMADKVVVMNQGRIEQEGAPEEIFRRPRSEFVASFFGYLNIFDGKVVETRPEVSTVEFPDGSRVKVQGPLPRGDQVRLKLRVERARVTTSAVAQPGHSTLSGQIASSDYLGPTVRYVVTTGGRDVSILQPDDGRVLRQGDQVTIHIAHDAWMMLSS